MIGCLNTSYKYDVNLKKSSIKTLQYTQKLFDYFDGLRVDSPDDDNDNDNDYQPIPSLSNQFADDLKETSETVKNYYMLIEELDKIENPTIKQITESKKVKAAKLKEIQTWLEQMNLNLLFSTNKLTMSESYRRKKMLVEISNNLSPTTQNDPEKIELESKYKFQLLFYEQKKFYMHQLLKYLNPSLLLDMTTDSSLSSKLFIGAEFIVLDGDNHNDNSSLRLKTWLNRLALNTDLFWTSTSSTSSSSSNSFSSSSTSLQHN